MRMGKATAPASVASAASGVAKRKANTGWPAAGTNGTPRLRWDRLQTCPPGEDVTNVLRERGRPQRGKQGDRCLARKRPPALVGLCYNITAHGRRRGRLPTAVPVPNDTSQPLLELEGLNRWYGTQHALQDVSLRLEPGRI